jgi:hypothetical protein
MRISENTARWVISLLGFALMATGVATYGYSSAADKARAEARQVKEKLGQRLAQERAYAQLRQGLPQLLAGETYAVHADDAVRAAIIPTLEAFGATPVEWRKGALPYLTIRQQGTTLNAHWQFNDRFGRDNPALTVTNAKRAAFAIAADAGSWRSQELQRELTARITAAYELGD